MKMIYDVKDKPKFGQVIVFAIQQLLAIMAATLVVPVIIGHGMQPTAALFGAGIGTLVYLCFTKFRSPVFLGSSFAFLGSMAAAFAGGFTGAAMEKIGYLGLIIGAVLAGLVYVVIALIVKFCGVKWVNKLMPAVVIGPTVAIIGLSLAGNAIGDLNKVNYTQYFDQNDYQIVEISAGYSFDEENGFYTIAPEEGSKTYIVLDKDVDITQPIPKENVHTELTVNLDDKTKEIKDLSATPGSIYVAIICGLITLAVTMLASTFGKKFTKLVPFIIGIAAGYIAATIFYFIGKATGNPALMIINFAPFEGLLKDGAVTIETFINVNPGFTFLTAFDGAKVLADEFAAGNSGEFVTYIISLIAAYVPVAFVVFAEHIADHKNISSIIEKDLLEDPGLHRTLLGDGVGSMAGAFFGGCPNTTYGESVACVAITRNASVVTILTAAIGAILISFFSPFVALVNTIPSCVMGGVCMALYGFIAVSGLKMIQKVDLNKNRNLFVVSVILIAGIGGLVLNFGQVKITSIACALILGILTNVMLSKEKDEPTE